MFLRFISPDAAVEVLQAFQQMGYDPGEREVKLNYLLLLFGHPPCPPCCWPACPVALIRCTVALILAPVICRSPAALFPPSGQPSAAPQGHTTLLIHDAVPLDLSAGCIRAPASAGLRGDAGKGGGS